MKSDDIIRMAREAGIGQTGLWFSCVEEELKRFAKLVAAAEREAMVKKDLNQDWDLLAETQAALRDAWAILKKLKAVQDAARELVESDSASAADTEGETFAAWCALVAAIDDADIMLCEFGESRE